MLDATFPYPMQYLGSKSRISGWILDQALNRFGTPDIFVDAMAGSGSVSHAAHLRGLKLGINDIQPYSHIVLSAAFDASRDTLSPLLERIQAGEVESRLLQGGRERYRTLLEEEDRICFVWPSSELSVDQVNQFLSRNCGNPSDATGDFDLFISYYRNTYLGVRQCLELDTLCQIAAEIDLDAAIHLRAALVSSVSRVASTTTHLAQFLKPGTPVQTANLIKKRQLSIIRFALACLESALKYPRSEHVAITNASFEKAIPNLLGTARNPLIYADPPYFKEHYSRYYHLLDTLVLYDYPELTWNKRIGSVTVGMYRKERISSSFGLRSQVRNAFNELMVVTQSVSGNLALSYADTSLLDADEIIKVATDNGLRCDVRKTDLRHSGQGVKNQSVTEYLFLIASE